MAEWTKKHIMTLISLYQGRSELYNTKNNLYKNKNARLDALEKIQEEMCKIREGTTLEDVKTKINCLRTHYCHELKKVKESAKSGAGPDEVYKPTVWWFGYLDFLKDFVRSRQSEQSFITIINNSKEKSDEIISPPKKLKTDKSNDYCKKSLFSTATELLDSVHDSMKDEFPRDIRNFLNFVGSELMSIDNPRRGVLKKKIILYHVFTATKLHNFNQLINILFYGKMIANILDKISVYQINVSNKINSINKLLSSKTIHYRRKRQQHLRNVLYLRRKSAFLLSKILKSKASKKVWMKRQASTFWEKEVSANDNDFFKENFRMSRNVFDILCSKLTCLEKSDTTFRKCIPLQKRVAIAIYSLGSSAEYRSIANLFGVGKSTVCHTVKEFCREVWRKLQPEYLNTYPLKEEKVKECVEGFQQIGFPQCFGAIDGCHIEIKPHAEDATDYFNYKGWYSTVLLAVVDYRYRFLYINVGSPGRCNDSQIFEKSMLKKLHQDPILKRMAKEICGVNVPVFLIGDSAFRFSDLIIKPYPFSVEASNKEKNFNYVLSKCRRVVENAFGHVKARFRRIGKGLDNHIDNTSDIIKCCCLLHNFLNEHNDKINSQWIQHQQEHEKNQVRQQPEFNTTITDRNTTAEAIRNAISTYLELQLGVEVTGGDDDGDGVSVIGVDEDSSGVCDSTNRISEPVGDSM